MLNSISISVSDDDSEEPVGRMKARVRRNRKRSFFRAKGGFLGRALRLLTRWWPLLVFASAFALLVFESLKLGKNQGEAVKVDLLHSERYQQQRSNLNRLDPTTRIVNGVREVCLKMLKPEEIQQLEFPVVAKVTSTVKNVVYKSDLGNFVTEGNNTFLSHFGGTTRLNFFTGNQTLEEREESFKVKETAEVHCGFYSEYGGFKISHEDRRYMETCEVVVSTCAFGGGDDLYQPVGMTEASLKKVCYVAFWDEITRVAQETEGNKIRDYSMIGKWRIVIVKDLPFVDQRLNGKIPKMLIHRLFPQARYSIWVDSKSQFRRDPIGVLEALLWRTNSVFAISEHGARSSLYEEAKAVVKKHKATPEEVDVQIKQYHLDGIPEDRRLHGKKGFCQMDPEVNSKWRFCGFLGLSSIGCQRRSLSSAELTARILSLSLYFFVLFRIGGGRRRSRKGGKMWRRQTHLYSYLEFSKFPTI